MRLKAGKGFGETIPQQKRSGGSRQGKDKDTLRVKDVKKTDNVSSNVLNASEAYPRLCSAPQCHCVLHCVSCFCAVWAHYSVQARIKWSIIVCVSVAMLSCLQGLEA